MERVQLDVNMKDDLIAKTHYLHSEIDTLGRVEILHDLRLGVYDVVVGINLLREGLDLPEMSLVAILDADKEGYLRSKGALLRDRIIELRRNLDEALVTSPPLLPLLQRKGEGIA